MIVPNTLPPYAPTSVGAYFYAKKCRKIEDFLKKPLTNRTMCGIIIHVTRKNKPLEVMPMKVLKKKTKKKLRKCFKKLIEMIVSAIVGALIAKLLG